MKLNCVNATHGFCTKPTGEVMPCCISAERVTVDNRTAVLGRDDAWNIWNSDYLANLRKSLDQGIEHANCRQCWSEERAGYKSKRIRDNERWAELADQPTGVLPKLLDLSLGNTCNLACRSCGPFASSRWYKEAQRTQSANKITLKQLNDQIDSSYNDQARVWDFLDQAIPQVVHIDFYGGEPMLVKRHWAMLEEIPLERAKDITLHFNTNGTQWDDDYVEILKRFKAVVIDISIDGVGKMFEYMRWPAKWPEVNANMLKFKELSDNNPQIQVGICITLSILNIWGLPETVDYARSLNMGCYLNLLFSPEYFCLKNLPDNARDLVLDHLALVQHEQIDSVREFIRTNKFSRDLRQRMIQTLLEHDALRNQNIDRLIPELWEAISNV